MKTPSKQVVYELFLAAFFVIIFSVCVFKIVQKSKEPPLENPPCELINKDLCVDERFW